jgi:peptidoglycan-associated lipoprotein
VIYNAARRESLSPGITRPYLQFRVAKIQAVNKQGGLVIMKNWFCVVVGVWLLVALPMLVSCKAKPSAPEPAPPPSVEMETEDVPEPRPAPTPRREPEPTAETIRPSVSANDYNRQKVLKTIYFDFDRANIKDEYKATLQQNARWLKEHAEFDVVLEGHCDERGTNEYNLSLGDRRATSTRQYLSSLGVQARRLRTISYGEERPAVQGHSESAWSKNRRAEFRVVER